MNTGLAFFAFLLIVLGAVYFYPISILGVFLLIAALLVPSKRPPPRPQPVPPEKRPTAVPPRTHAPAAAMPSQPQPQAQPQPPQPMQPPMMGQAATATPVLFPTTMFPSINPIAPAQQPPEKPQAERVESRDEVLELAAIAVFLRLLSGYGT